MSGGTTPTRNTDCRFSTGGERGGKRLVRDSHFLAGLWSRSSISQERSRNILGLRPWIGGALSGSYDYYIGTPPMTDIRVDDDALFRNRRLVILYQGRVSGTRLVGPADSGVRSKE